MLRFGRGKTLQASLTVCCLMAFVLFGYDQGVFGGILENEDFLSQFGYPSDTKTGIIVSCYNLGCFAGCTVNYFIGDLFGRRYTIWLAMIFVLVGAALQTSAFTIAHLIVGRVITGLGTGIKTSTVLMYQSEMRHSRVRGRLVSTEVLFVGVGIVIAYWFDFGLSYVGGPLAWRLPIAVQMIFVIVVVVIVAGLPESPRWLYARGREGQAREVLCIVYDREASDQEIASECEAIRTAIEREVYQNKSKSLVHLLFTDDTVKTGRRVILAWRIQFMNQVSGINLIVYYAPINGPHAAVLVQNIHFNKKLAQILAGCINSMFFFGSILPSLALDRMGRRKTMLVGCAGLSLCMLVIAVLLSRPSITTNTNPNREQQALPSATASAAVAFMFLYMLIYGMTANCVPWVYVPEILPLDARTRGTAIGTSSNWIWNFVVVMITPVIIARLSFKAYLIFTATNAAFVVLVWWLFPETGNLRLEDVDCIFARGGDLVKVAREVGRELTLYGRVVMDSVDQGQEQGQSGHSFEEVEKIEMVHES